MQQIVQIVTTLETSKQANELAEMCISAKLAACCQVVGPIHSVYRWQGKVCTGEEFRCSLKTTTARVEQLVSFLKEKHPYDLPEILAEEVQSSDEYGQWVAEQVDNT